MPATPFAPPLPTADAASLQWQGLAGASLGLAVAEAARTQSRIVVVANSSRELQLLENEIRFFLPTGAPPLRRLPDWECLPYDHFSPHPEITSERLQTLACLSRGEAALVLLTLEVLQGRLPPVDFVLGRSFRISSGTDIDFVSLRAQLPQVGYLAVSQVMAPGEYAIRGGVFDIFPMGSDTPFRLDLFGDEVQSIRYFDPETQKSTRSTSQLEILPAREFPLEDVAIEQFRANYRREFAGDPQSSLIYREVSCGNLPAGIEYYFPLFFEPGTTASLFDYMPDDTCWLLPGNPEAGARKISAAVLDRYQQRSIDFERLPLAPNRLYLSVTEFSSALQSAKKIFLVDQDTTAETNAALHDFGVVPPPAYPVDASSNQPYARLTARLRDCRPWRILLSVDSAGRSEALRDVLEHYDIHPARLEHWHAFTAEQAPVIGIVTSALDRGVQLPLERIEIITESQLYGERVHQRRRETRDPGSILRTVAELHTGDPVVHCDHGIGRYAGLETLKVAGTSAEFAVLRYQDNDRLYVPVFNLASLARYLGGDAENAPLHRLGNANWNKAKARAARRAHDVAAELLKTQALRSLHNGSAFTVPEDDYLAFAGRFSFDETPDQEVVINEVLDDLRSAAPMDRLVCGDVGFGKTEVALRAAFIVVSNSHQVAILTPTTLLAGQHFETFRDRFADMAIRVELLSRFRDRAHNAATTAGLQSGEIDIVIGTHRLLQSDVVFRSLGLVIIDEEHRFGVRQKERLKQLRQEVDILALTATPIPRTLNIGLAGLRAISLIGTPPPNRVSIKTFVRSFGMALVREACLREIHRGGQVYYLHNTVRTIGEAASRLADAVPEASIRIAHGQMPEVELERVMQDFYHQRFNILVCSTIIESGIDVPTANTIIIDRADRLGLAQLHQLRGRVGRSRHQAYAFLLTPAEGPATVNAAKRLEAIVSLSELGAGFTLASHDLEIRGAGELLGEGQSGAIDEIGFSLYTEYLTRAIRDLGQKEQSSDCWVNAPIQKPEINLEITALFPDSYLPDVHSRLLLYQRIAAAQTEADLYELQLEIVDRFGLLPVEVKALLRISVLQLRAAAIGIRTMEIGSVRGKLGFQETAVVEPIVMTNLLARNRPNMSMSSPIEMRLQHDLPEPLDRLTFAEKLIGNLMGEDAEQVKLSEGLTHSECKR